jgi:hypothetical protein
LCFIVEKATFSPLFEKGGLTFLTKLNLAVRFSAAFLIWGAIKLDNTYEVDI